MGIDSARPQLSWRVASDGRDARQTAFEVLVASSKDALAEDQGDLWGSGKRSTSKTMVDFEKTEPLKSGQRCYWKVRVWDANGKASPWSEPAEWSMGLLSEADWQAEWIGYDEQRRQGELPTPFEGAQWICFASEQPSAPAGSRLYVLRTELPEGIEIARAELLAVADDTFDLAINGDVVVEAAHGWQRARPKDVAASLRGGKNEFRARVVNNSPGPTGLLLKLTVTTTDGKTISIASNGQWRSAANPGESWENRPLKKAELSDCNILGAYGMAPWGNTAVELIELFPPPMLRQEFQVSKPIRRATLYASALGVCDVHLNGNRVSDDYFTPGWTDYEKRVYYRAYDVTSAVKQGGNAVGGVLSDGWYSGYIGWGRQRDHYGTKPRLRVQLNLEYEDGTSEVVATGPDWKAAYGPILEADFLMGETYDARLELDGWDKPGFDDAPWQPVQLGAEMQPVLESHAGPPVVAIKEFKPKTITEPSPGVYVFDLGRNFAGVARLRVQESAPNRSRSASPSGSTRTARSTRRTSEAPGRPTATSAAATASRSGSRGSPSTASSTSR